MFELVDNVPDSAVIKVIGVGGGGGNAVKHMIANAVQGVDFICANTDAQALADVDSRTVLQMGSNITKGLGAGANPDIGRAAAMEDRDRIAEALSGADMVFITAGMGGGTGTGGAPVVAEVARELGILTVAVAALARSSPSSTTTIRTRCLQPLPQQRPPQAGRKEKLASRTFLRPCVNTPSSAFLRIRNTAATETTLAGR